MIVTIIIIFGAIVILTVAYRAIDGMGNGLGNQPSQATRSDSAGVYVSAPDQPSHELTIGHIATLEQQEASHREYRARVASNQMLDDWQERLEREIREGRK